VRSEKRKVMGAWRFGVWRLAFGVAVDEVDLVDGVDSVEVNGPLAVGGSMRMKMDVWRSLTTGECGDVRENVLL
jgi:hypothetical protein